ncbi:MAG: cation transporter [Rhodospirillaceae bacterium]
MTVADLMTLGEFIIGLVIHSASLQADALKACHIAAMGFTIAGARAAILNHTEVRHDAMKALLFNGMMGVFAIWVLGVTVWELINGLVPRVEAIAIVGSIAAATNASCFVLLWSYRTASSSMRTACNTARNDVLGNLAVLLAALGVYITGQVWPDAVVGAVLAALVLYKAGTTMLRARDELRQSSVSQKARVAPTKPVKARPKPKHK